MAFGAEHEQAASGEHLLTLSFDLGLDPLKHSITLRAFRQVLQFVITTELQIAAKLDVGPAAGHVGGNCDRAKPPSLSNDVGFHFVEAGVEDVVLDPFLPQEFGEHFRLFNRNRPHQNWLAAILVFLDCLGDPAELVLDRLVEHVLLVGTQDRHVGRNGDDVHFVDVKKFSCFGRGGAGHPAKLRIHSEIVLEGDRSHGLIFRLDLDAFLGFHRLVQPVRPTPSVHHPPGKLINDDDLVILDDVIDVALEHHVGLQALVKVMNDLRVFNIVEV